MLTFHADSMMALVPPQSRPPLPADREFLIIVTDGEAVSHNTWEYLKFYDRGILTTMLPKMPDCLEPATYHLRLPVPGSAGLPLAAKLALIPSGDRHAPLLLIATARLCITQAFDGDPLGGNFCLCADRVPDDHYAGICWPTTTQKPVGTRDGAWIASYKTT